MFIHPVVPYSRIMKRKCLYEESSRGEWKEVSPGNPKYLSVSCTEGMALSLSPRTPVTPPPNSQLIRVQIFIDTFSSLDIFFKNDIHGLEASVTDLGAGAFLTPGSGSPEYNFLGWNFFVNWLDSCSKTMYFLISWMATFWLALWVKLEGILNLFFPSPRDPRWNKKLSRIRDKHPRSTTMIKPNYARWTSRRILFFYS